MLLVQTAQSRLIAITISMFFSLLIDAQASADEVTGNCNVISPSGNVSGNISYKINCNNISAEAGDQITKILKIIEENSKKSSKEDFSKILSVILQASQKNLAELRKTRSPKIELSSYEVQDCSTCSSYVDFLNTGGMVQRIEGVDVLEVVRVNLAWHVSDNGQEVACPFQRYKYGESSEIIMDYDWGEYLGGEDSKVSEGGTLVSLEFSNRLVRHKDFKKKVLQHYNERKKYISQPTIKKELLDWCTEFNFNIGIKFSLRNYHGTLYEQYFVFEYKYSFGDVRLVPKPFEVGKSGYENLLNEYERAKAERDGIVNYSAIVSFMLKHSLQ